MICPTVSFGQDFIWELKMYMIQDFVKENHIKIMRIGTGNDSSIISNDIKREYHFDELGRLAEMSHQFNSDMPDRKIVYKYNSPHPFYSSKMDFWIDSTDKYHSGMYAHGYMDSSASRLNQFVLSGKGDTIRWNSIQFNDQNKITFRETRSKDRIYELSYSYNLTGQFEEMKWWVKFPKLNIDSLVKVSRTGFTYNTDNQIKSYVKVNSENISDTISEARFTWDQNGTLNITCNYKIGDLPKSHIYKVALGPQGILNSVLKIPEVQSKYQSPYFISFEFEFYTETEMTGKHRNQFISSYFAPLFFTYGALY
jgi:hypothetical protein